MIEQGDRVMVCVSGGKDSYGGVHPVEAASRVPLSVLNIVGGAQLDQKQPGFPAHILPEYLAKLGIEFHIETQDTPTASSKS